MKNQELFRPGQNVTWGDRDETMKAVTRNEGPGPFKILTVEDIPEDKCSCGGSLDDDTHQVYNECPYSNTGSRPIRESVGHSQWVTIDDGTGKPLTDKFSDKERIRKFSGAYFKAV